MNDIIIDHGDLPDVASARLPATYEAAVLAIRECARMDECKDWADRAAAMASYAKQAQDETLLKMARRIQLRAYDRCGELLKEYEAPANQHEAARAREGGLPSRSEAAETAGLTEHERKTALRIASVKDAEFETLVESDEPPTITEMARRGTQHLYPPGVDDYLRGRDPNDFQQATQLLGLAGAIPRTAPGINIEAGIRGLEPQERQRVLDLIDQSMTWLGEVLDGLQ